MNGAFFRESKKLLIVAIGYIGNLIFRGTLPLSLNKQVPQNHPEVITEVEETIYHNYLTLRKADTKQRLIQKLFTLIFIVILFFHDSTDY
jgi:hypothetical protein